MTFEELKDKALRLPMEPGVYIMRDKNDKVIYVGKAKKLKNRVSQYFHDTASHSPKTRLMVSRIDHFDVLIARSEFEALVLECSLIKQHLPKYNILLKDDKGYPYLRLDLGEEYPKITLENQLASDGAEYFGPYGSRGVTNALLEAIIKTLKLPDCGRIFPRDVGKYRPCLNYHINQCEGWCQPGCTQQQYRAVIQQARQLLLGNYKSVTEEIRREMVSCAENLEFERAAMLRDRLAAVENLGKKQIVTAGASADTDVIGFYQNETKACFAVLHYSGGSLVDKDYEIISAVDDPAEAVSSLLKQYYLSRGIAPKRILLPVQSEDSALFSQLLLEQYGKKVQILCPQRGEKAQLVDLANKNAFEEAKRVTDKEERLSGILQLLGKMLSIAPPSRIESYDISNISGTDIVGSMVVFQEGKPLKSEYKKFKLRNLDNQDDYASMQQVLERRFRRYLEGDSGFASKPDLLLIDGGITHANTALEVLNALELSIPVFGMVKDDRHRTRALVTPEGNEIRIDNNQNIFSLIGNIQEETHRFAINYHRDLRSKHLRYSQLDSIPGIGPKRKSELLKTFGSINVISQASVTELERILPKDAAAAVYHHFHNREEA